jgi:Na+/melibiose symporter-like transporter
MFGMFFFASLYVQEVLHDSPLTAGLAFLPVTGGIMIGSGLAQAAMKRVGVRNLTATGTIVAAAGLLLLTRLPVHGHYAADLLPGLLLLSIGMGLTFVPMTPASPRASTTSPSRSGARSAWRSSRRSPPAGPATCSTPTPRDRSPPRSPAITSRS